jgi:Ca2+-transporting ATPase
VDSGAARIDEQPRLTVRHAEAGGRVRLDVPTLYRNRRRCERLVAELAKRPGVARVEANPVTGSVLVRFATPLTGDVVGRLVAELAGCAPPPTSAPPSAPSTPPRTARTARLNHPISPPPPSTASRQRASPVPSEGPPWHALPADQIANTLGVDLERGLTVVEAQRRLAQFGPNRFEQAEPRSDLRIFLGQFNSLPVGLLGVAAAIAVATGGPADALVIGSVVLINAVIGFYTERQAERTIAALARLGPRHAEVLRDGARQCIPIEVLAPGDVVLLAPGSYVPADARLLAARRLSIDESALTGESVPIAKTGQIVVPADTPLGDRRNMVHMGSVVTGGDGVAIVTTTGAHTEIGRIQAMVDEAESPETPMERQLHQLGTQLGLLSAGVCAAVFGVGVLRGVSLLEMLKSAVSLAVAAVPEGLPAVATTTLALGVREMQRRNVAVRELAAVETLGSVQVICLDKTGTLTRNRMTLVALHLDLGHLRVEDGRFLDDTGRVDPLQRPCLWRLLEIVSLCSEVDIGPNGTFTGTPTELALVEAAHAAAVDVATLHRHRPRLELRPRAEGRPLMSTVHDAGTRGRLVAVKGSPAEVLERCTEWCRDGRVEPLDEATREAILRGNERMAGDALRVLGVAYAEGDAARDADAHGLVWLGLAGLTDPLRSGMPELMRQFHGAGIETVMITGDQSATAYAIGRELGLANGRPLQILDSLALDKVDPKLLAGLGRTVQVFARVSPAHKLRIVQALQRSGSVVAMTGDGINDGPALKAADIGVAMGGAGSEVARQVADVVVEDDNLHTLIEAVAHGRAIYANIRKSIHYMLSTNSAEIEVMFASLVLGLGQPLNPMQLLWINLITDIFPGLALSLEPADPDLMRRPPRDPAEPVVRREDLGRMALESGVISLGALAAYAFGLARYGQGAQAGTLAFNTLTLAQLLHSLSCRSEAPVLLGSHHLPGNDYLDLALGGSLALQAAAMALPPLRALLGTAVPGLADLAVIGAGAVLPLLVNEASKSVRGTGGAPQGDA